MNIYEGDLKIILTENGATCSYMDGQPVMDAGLENSANISLFTRNKSRATNREWYGNKFFRGERQIGSDFEAATDQPITLSSINRVERASNSALRSSAYGTVETDVVNPNGSQYNVTVKLTPPAADATTLLLARYGGAWVQQITDPAYRRV
jgi:phage gp46-like protein